MYNGFMFCEAQIANCNDKYQDKDAETTLYSQYKIIVEDTYRVYNIVLSNLDYYMPKEGLNEENWDRIVGLFYEEVINYITGESIVEELEYDDYEAFKEKLDTE